MENNKKRMLSCLILILAIVAAFALILTQFNFPAQCPKITSPENTTYDRNNIILAVSCKDIVLWMANSFDGGPNITECGNCNSYSRYDLIFTKGTHTITVYASDSNNKISKSSVTFSVE